jgi:hypothetical protein
MDVNNLFLFCIYTGFRLMRLTPLYLNLSFLIVGSNKFLLFLIHRNLTVFRMQELCFLAVAGIRECSLLG